MSYFLIGFGLFLLFLAYKLNSFKRNMNRMQPGNIWETKGGDIIIIKDIGDVKDKYLIKAIKNGKYTSYNSLGEQQFDPSKKMHKYIGTIETHPEYFL